MEATPRSGMFFFHSWMGSKRAEVPWNLRSLSPLRSTHLLLFTGLWVPFQNALQLWKGSCWWTSSSYFKVHKKLRLPRNLHFKVHKKYCACCKIHIAQPRRLAARALQNIKMPKRSFRLRLPPISENEGHDLLHLPRNQRPRPQCCASHEVCTWK